jgi:CubicO group peptidase (beta-lactamase class C family)
MTLLKPALLYPLIFLVMNSSVMGQGIRNEFPLQEKVAKLMDDAMKNSDLPAVVALAITKNGQRLTYTFGKAVWTGKEKITTQHIFRIYSMTKLVTSIAAMQLVEKKLIGLDDDLSVMLPEMTTIPILSDGQLIKSKNPITLRHLLTHTSGFGYSSTDEALSKFDRTDWKYKDLPRRFESGTQFLYGSSTDWAGRLVEKISKMSLEEYFRKNITGPLSMNRTWFNVPDSLKRWIVSRGSRGDDGKQPLTEQPDRIPTKPTTEYSGGGGLFSTPDDFGLLLQCLLNYGTLNGTRILQRETLMEMTKNQIGDISLKEAGAYFNPGSCCNFKGITSATSKWGLAWLIDNEDKPYGRKAGTVLWGGLLNTYFYIDYRSGIAASIYTQHLPFNHPATMTLFDKFSELIYSRP